MPKPKNSSVLTCDICDFKVTNGYIFKRHLHRCLSLHGIASKRSSPRNPVRLKGTEGLLNKDGLQPETEKGKSALHREDHPQDAPSDEVKEAVEDVVIGATGEEEVSGSVSSMFSQWGVTHSPQTDGAREQIDGERGHGNTEVEDDSSSKVSVQKEGTVTPGAPYTRTYKCSSCEFGCKSARGYLFHLRDDHGQKRPIYECNLCDYASHYNNKVERHMAVHNKVVISTSDSFWKRKHSDRRRTASLKLEKKDSDKDELEENTTDDSGTLKVKPLKLKRLNIKMPSLFKVTGHPRFNLNSSNTSYSRYPRGRSREVFKMTLLEDGTHRYQCRDCLYFSPHSHNVKKHHALCHDKILACPHCSDFTSTGQASYYEHLLTHEGRGYTKCPDCSYVTSAKSNFEKHRSFHEGEFPFKCPVCNFGSDSESKIKRHVATQHRNPDTVNEMVPVGEMDVSEGVDINGEDWEEEDEGAEESQDLSEEEYTPNIVAGGPKKASSMSRRQQSGLQYGRPSDPVRMEYRCPKCPMICYRRGNFTRHLTAKHKYNQSSAASASKMLETPLTQGLKRKILPMSRAQLKQKRLLLQSIGGESLKCSHCSYSAKWPSDLRRHLQVHTIVKRFKCSLCPNKYKYYGDLNVHMRRDHNAEPPDKVSKEVTSSDVVKKASPALFRCPICLFTTHSKAELEQHSRCHGSIDKTYQCRLCDYQTYWRGDVGRHLFRHHSLVLSKEATEMSNYFIHRPEIRPITKQLPNQVSALGIASLQQETPMETDDTDMASSAPVSPGFVKESTPDSSRSSSSSKVGSGPIYLKEGSFVCEYPNCDYKASTSDRMETHLAIHLNLKQFMCPICGKRTNWKWDVVKHMIKVHSNPEAVVEDVITLSIDEAKSSIDEYLNVFEKRQKNMSINICSLCPFKSHEKNRVVRHMGTVHKNENGKVLTHIMSNPEEYEASLLLEKERSLCTERSAEIARDDSPVVEKFGEPTAEELALYDHPYACAICKKPGNTRGDVKKHYNYTHPYKDVRILYIPKGTEFNYYTGEIYRKSGTFETADEADANNGQLSPSSKMVKPDSKYSNPKMHGYVKPFKCSICGLRSNWKWDLKKHLRAKHPNKGGFVIMLSIAEAQETYGTECSPSHPKNEDFLSIPKTSSSPVSFTSSTPSLTQEDDQHLFKQPLSVKCEVLDPVEKSESRIESFQSPSRRYRCRDKSTSFDPNRRQWKCSGCEYISNWRRNMARHIHRKHPYDQEIITVIPLHSTLKQSTQSLMDKYLKHGMPSMVGMGNRNGLDSLLLPPADIQPSIVSSDSRQWRCPKCPFVSQLRTHIIVHMQKHDMKPFRCGVCQVPFMNRGPLHRHIQKVHRRSDYVKLSKLNIKYDESNVLGSSDQEPVINTFFCRFCNQEFEEKPDIVKHLEEVHESFDNDNDIVKVQKYFQDIPKPTLEFQSVPKPDPQKLGGRKVHFCPLCPFRSQKKSMLAFHMTYHRPSAAHKFKCKYCPYYVSTTRLLHQHQKKWHTDAASRVSWDQQQTRESPVQAHIPPPPQQKPEPYSAQLSTGNQRRHSCEKCPYTTNSKNDFIYHKQFHRPKRTAEFKCEYCDYWVVHKRLLKQHTRLHTAHKRPEKKPSSTDTSPVKSVYSDPGLVYDPVELSELASIKQKMISSKITASLSKSPNVSPMKLASQCSVDNKPGYVMKNGLYRKLHKCQYCPYTNIRARNMQLHELMHGPRESPHPLMKCPYCDYYVGSKGLLSHHMKVHQKSYGDTPENDAEMAELNEGLDDIDELEQDILPQQKVDTLLQISRFKRFGCERCPYASAKRAHFKRHLELHGSRQRYTCQYCDYSVPSNNLLLQHTKLHLMPNQNLLSSQSVANLQQLSEVPADVALASALPPADTDTLVTISVIHDHLSLYENSIYDSEPKKLYRCDRCPYANVRRDYLLSHLKFHMVPSTLVCPYCDYSAPKQALLTQHIRVHFCPLPELSDWLLENGQTDRETSQRNVDLAEALRVAHEYQNQSKKKGRQAGSATGDKGGDKDEKPEGKENILAQDSLDGPLTYVCQYCDREFSASEKLVKHELQHLIGNHFERTEYISRNKTSVDQASMKAPEGLQDNPEGLCKEEMVSNRLREKRGRQRDSTSSPSEDNQKFSSGANEGRNAKDISNQRKEGQEAALPWSSGQHSLNSNLTDDDHVESVLGKDISMTPADAVEAGNVNAKEFAIVKDSPSSDSGDRLQNKEEEMMEVECADSGSKSLTTTENNSKQNTCKVERESQECIEGEDNQEESRRRVEQETDSIERPDMNTPDVNKETNQPDIESNQEKRTLQLSDDEILEVAGRVEVDNSSDGQREPATEEELGKGIGNDGEAVVRDALQEEKNVEGTDHKESKSEKMDISLEVQGMSPIAKDGDNTSATAGDDKGASDVKENVISATAMDDESFVDENVISAISTHNEGTSCVIEEENVVLGSEVLRKNEADKDSPLVKDDIPLSGDNYDEDILLGGDLEGDRDIGNVDLMDIEKILNSSPEKAESSEIR